MYIRKLQTKCLEKNFVITIQKSIIKQFRVSLFKRGLNSSLGIDGILITMLNNRTNYSKEIVNLLDEAYGGAVHIYDSKIPFSVRAAEATAEGVSIFKHDPKGKVANAYMDFTQEVLANE